MAVVDVAGVDAERVVDTPLVVLERLEAFGSEVLAEAMNRPVQLTNGGLYLQGLIEHGARKSLEPMVARLGAGDYQSLQQFLADSPWDPAVVMRAVAERVAPVIDVQAWVLDDTGFPKDGKRSPGVKRQYSGTLGKIGNCQIGVSLHAVGTSGTVPLGWALYARAQPVLATVSVSDERTGWGRRACAASLCWPGLGDAAVVAEARPRAGRSGDSRVRAGQTRRARRLAVRGQRSLRLKTRCVAACGPLG